MIEVKDLVKQYGGRRPVGHLRFTVEDGQIFGLLGPNGAGKSTTMNIMTGYLAATEGDVLIEGHSILNEPEEAKTCLGYLPELPERWTQFDLTDSGIYDITDTSRDYLAHLTEDVAIHVLADKDDLDSRIVRFLDIYTDLGGHLSLDYTDPLVFPSVLSEYGVDSGSVVVTCEATGRPESFSIDDIFEYDIMSYYYYGIYNETAFDGEGLLTAAVDSVLTDAARTVYQTSGHGETALSADVTEQLRRSHVALGSVNLLTDGGIPAGCDLLLLNVPTRDLADDEPAAVRAYLSNGGQVFYAMAAQLDALPNLEALCGDYGITAVSGIVADTQRYYQNDPALFFPVLDTGVCGGLTDDAVVLFYATRDLTLTEPARETIAVQPFLTTSGASYAVTGEETSSQGTFTVGAVATEETDNGTARFTVLGSDSLTNDEIAASFSNLDNGALFLSAITAGFGDVDAISIEPVSLTTVTNTISSGGIWALLFILVIPGALLVFGFVRWMRRRKL